MLNSHSETRKIADMSHTHVYRIWL